MLFTRHKSTAGQKFPPLTPGKRRCLMHIGAQKTGSTTIQNSLLNYDDGTTRYTSIGHKYGNPNVSVPLLMAGADQEWIDRLYNAAVEADGGKVGVSRFPIPVVSLLKYKVEPSNKAWRDILRQLLKEDTSQQTIFSGEGLFSHSQSAAGIMDLLSEKYDESAVLCYSRPPVSFFFASMHEHAKRPVPRAFFTVAQKFESLIGFDPDTWIRRVTAWLPVCDNALFIPFDHDGLVGNDIVEDFAFRTGLDVSKIGKIDSNIGLSAEAFSIQMAHSYYGHDQPVNEFFASNHNLLTSALRSFGANRLRPSARLSREFSARNKHLTRGYKQYFGPIREDTPHGKWAYIDKFSDILEICEDVIPAFKTHIKDHWGVDLGASVTNPPSLSRALSNLYLQDPRERDVKIPPHFDPKRYLELNPDLAVEGFDVVGHYRKHGIFEGREV